ncbi:hypothetical protein [Hahella ganghwensis]|uniref:hypothetical protein n=1 Tax=Hahella ganghwensis TaxID=286420 RepID=UPI00037670B7|nr:hypothetical protein [Hahella ganghwensis]
MTESYGASWVRQFGDVSGEAYKTWSAALSGYSEHQIGNAFHSLLEEGAEMPPTLGKFIKLAKGLNRNTEGMITKGAAIESHKYLQRALPVPPEVTERRRELARENLSKLIASLA